MAEGREVDYFNFERMNFNPKCHAVIKGWDALYRYCERCWNQRPIFCEHFARIDNLCHIQKIEAKSPEDEYWTAYFLVAMPSVYGRIVFPDDREVYVGINNGTIKPLNE